MTAAATPAQHVAWFQRTRHCGGCGQPGNYCRCTTPCGCHELHQVGSGLIPEALQAFATTEAAPPAEQGALFDE